MKLPVMPPVAPMLAKLARELPPEGPVVYEPKWDGFRSVVFRDGDEVELGSRNERPLTRYFPELAGALLAGLPERCVVDGEIVIAGPNGLDFDALLQRIHPAASRVRRLAAETPASFVAFDLLALGDDDLRPLPFARRRAALEEALGHLGPPLYLTPATSDRALALDWFDRFEGAGLDGVVAKGRDQPYREGQRTMIKVKHERTADCVVAGFRWHKAGGVVGSLLLGLYDGAGTLHHVGVTASFTAERRRALVSELEPYRAESLGGHPWEGWARTSGTGAGGAGATGAGGAGADASGAPVGAPGDGAPGDGAPSDSEGESGAPGGRRPGAPSRWNAGKDLSWEPLRPELVCEVAYDHLQGDRFRHATTFRRWRPDRRPETCRYDQLEVAVPEVLGSVFGT